jgi:hypothetical protein
VVTAPAEFIDQLGSSGCRFRISYAQGGPEDVIEVNSPEIHVFVSPKRNHFCAA